MYMKLNSFHSMHVKETHPTQLGPLERISLSHLATNVTCKVILINMRRLMMTVQGICEKGEIKYCPIAFVKCLY
jgi:hypothetical protein